MRRSTPKRAFEVALDNGVGGALAGWSPATSLPALLSSESAGHLGLTSSLGKLARLEPRRIVLCPGRRQAAASGQASCHVEQQPACERIRDLFEYPDQFGAVDRHG